MANRLFEDGDGIDEDACLAIYDNDHEFYKLVLDTFYKEIIKVSVGMKETFAAKDTENYRILVHGLKGAGGSAGAKHLVELATESNALIKAGDWEGSVKYHEPLLEELDRLMKLIPERIGSHR